MGHQFPPRRPKKQPQQQQQQQQQQRRRRPTSDATTARAPERVRLPRSSCLPTLTPSRHRPFQVSTWASGWGGTGAASRRLGGVEPAGQDPVQVGGTTWSKSDRPWRNKNETENTRNASAKKNEKETGGRRPGGGAVPPVPAIGAARLASPRCHGDANHTWTNGRPGNRPTLGVASYLDRLLFVIPNTIGDRQRRRRAKAADLFLFCYFFLQINGCVAGSETGRVGVSLWMVWNGALSKRFSFLRRRLAEEVARAGRRLAPPPVRRRPHLLRPPPSCGRTARARCKKNPNGIIRT